MEKAMSTTGPLVSVVCVTFNHAKFVAETLDGFLAQRANFPIEFLIHDDASTDGTSDIVREYAQRHPGVIIPIIQPINIYSQGIKPWLVCFERAQGKYIALCEGDDYWTDPLKLQKQVDFLEAHPDFELCFHQVLTKSRIQGRPDRLLPGKRSKTEFTTEDLIGPYFTHTSSMVFRRFDPSEFPTWFSTCMSGDIPLLFLLSLKGKFKLIDEVMSVWRQHNNSVSAKHLNYNRVRGMIYMYELFNAHTKFKYDDLFRSAFILELNQLPEMAELKELRYQVMPFSKKIKYFVRNRFSWLLPAKP